MKPGEHGLNVVANILVEARYAADDEAVCKRNGISSRSLRRYRNRLVEDTELATLVQLKDADIHSHLREKLVSLALAAINKATELVRKADSADHLHGVVGAAKIALDKLTEAEVLHGSAFKARQNPKASGSSGAAGNGSGSGAGTGDKRPATTPIN